MKRCKNGHTFQDDRLSFCTICGSPLEAFSEDGPHVNSTKKKKGGCLKKIIISFGVILIALYACYNYVVNAATYLRLEPSEIQFPKKGGNCNVDIDYNGYVWTVNHCPDWVEMTEFNDSFKIKLKPNQSGQNREGSITIQSGKCLAMLVIRQNTTATILKVSRPNIKFERAGGSKTVSLETDGCDYRIECPDWLEVSSGYGEKLEINCLRNTDDYRTGVIRLREDNAFCVINISQGGTCSRCHGNGVITCGACFGLGQTGYGLYSMTCMFCSGRGNLSCSLCDGKGYKE